MTTRTNRIDEEASAWAVRLGTRPLLPDEQQALDAWLAADTRHEGAFVRARAAWAGLDRFAALAAGRLADSSRARGFKRRWFIAAGISAVTLSGAASWLAFQSRGTRYASGIGELRIVPLLDGSNIVLNTSSEAVVHFDELRREVELRQGEALFEVAKDPSRPFLVRSNGVLVRAVGTAFAVRVADERVDVTVTEGVVEISREAGSANASVRRVNASEQAVVQAGRSIAVEPIRNEEAERRLAWRNGMVAFDGEPLSEAIAEVNRHNRRRIIVDDRTLAARPIVGIFRASDIESFAQTAAAALGAEAVVDGDLIRIQPSKKR